MIKSTNEVQVYEANGKEVAGVPTRYVLVKSHWNRSDLVVVQINEDTSVTVSAKDLQAAINNATNTGR